MISLQYFISSKIEDIARKLAKFHIVAALVLATQLTKE